MVIDLWPPKTEYGLLVLRPQLLVLMAGALPLGHPTNRETERERRGEEREKGGGRVLVMYGFSPIVGGSCSP